METKEGTKTLPVDEPDGKHSGGELAMEGDEVALETKFPAKKCVVEPEDVEWLCKAPKIRGNEYKSCCDRVKEAAVVAGTAGVSNEFVPEDGAEDEGWSESNMAATLLFVERPGIWVIWNAQWKKRSQKNSR